MSTLSLLPYFLIFITFSSTQSAGLINSSWCCRFRRGSNKTPQNLEALLNALYDAEAERKGAAERLRYAEAEQKNVQKAKDKLEEAKKKERDIRKKVNELKESKKKTGK